MDEAISTIRHALVLRRIEPERNVARFYALMIERDLFGRTVLVRHWGPDRQARLGADRNAGADTRISESD